MHLLLCELILAAQVSERERDVVLHGQVRIKGIVLEYEADAAVLRRYVGDVVLPEIDASLGRRLETADEVKRCGFAAAGRTEQSDQLAVGDFKCQIARCDNVFLDLFVPVREPFGQML